jgi:hypothetical protein
LDDRLPVTVAGAAAVLNRVPLNPLREPHAFSNANELAVGRQFRHRGRKFLRSALYYHKFLKITVAAKPVSLRKVRVLERFAAYRNSAKLREKLGDEAFVPGNPAHGHFDTLRRGFTNRNARPGREA